jgi:hypothetical protein
LVRKGNPRNCGGQEKENPSDRLSHSRTPYLENADDMPGKSGMNHGLFQGLKLFFAESRGPAYGTLKPWGKT